MKKLNISCKEVADGMLSGVAHASRKFYVDIGRKPTLTIYANGTAAGSAYVRNKIKACERVGIQCGVVKVEDHTAPHVVAKAIAQDPSDAIIVQLPMFGGSVDDVLVDSIPVEKDADGLSRNARVLPATVRGIINLLLENAFDSLVGQHVVIVGRSKLVGEPLAKLLIKSYDATVSVCNSKTPPAVLRALAKTADIIVAAVGKRNLLTADMVSPGAVVIDVGINTDENGKLCGDVAEDVSAIAEVTPVPGGVGLLTVASLMENVITLANERNYYAKVKETEKAE